MLDQFIKNLKDKEITDVLLVGFVDNEDGIYEFCPHLNYMYFELESKYIKLEQVYQWPLLRFDIVDSIDFEYEVDEDMARAKSSIAEIVLDDTMALGNNIKEVVFYELDRKQLICAAMELILANGQIIFIDPSYFWGMHVGGEKQKRIWADNYSNIDGVVISKISV